MKVKLITRCGCVKWILHAVSYGEEIVVPLRNAEGFLAGEGLACPIILRRFRLREHRQGRVGGLYRLYREV